MAIEVLALVLKHGPVNNTRKMILVALANYADPEGRCWPSVAKISQMASCSRSSVFAHMNVLCDGGWLQRMPDFRPNGSRKCSKYLINVSRLKQFEAAEQKNAVRVVDGFKPFPEDEIVIGQRNRGSISRTGGSISRTDGGSISRTGRSLHVNIRQSGRNARVGIDPDVRRAKFALADPQTSDEERDEIRLFLEKRSVLV